MVVYIQFVKVNHWRQKTVISKSYAMAFSNGQAGQHGRAVSFVRQQDHEHVSTNVVNRKLKSIISIVKGTTDNRIQAQIKFRHVLVPPRIAQMIRTGFHWLILIRMTSQNVLNLEVPMPLIPYKKLVHSKQKFTWVTRVYATMWISYFLGLEIASNEANAIVSFVEKSSNRDASIPKMLIWIQDARMSATVLREKWYVPNAGAPLVSTPAGHNGQAVIEHVVLDVKFD